MSDPASDVPTTDEGADATGSATATATAQPAAPAEGMAEPDDRVAPIAQPAAADARRLDDPRAFQVLTAEQASLMAARTMGQTETAGRAAMFVAALSGSIVAIALVAQASDFGGQTVAVALMLLPVTLFIGVSTVVRTVDIAIEEVGWVAALNRVRAAYVAEIPALADHLSTFRPDARDAVVATVSPTRLAVSPAYGLATTPGVVAVLDAVLAGGIAGVAISAATGVLASALVAAGVVFVIVLAALATWGGRVYAQSIDRV